MEIIQKIILNCLIYIIHTIQIFALPIPKTTCRPLSLLKTKKSGKTILGAEDGVNQSYCDLLFYVDATPGSSIDDPERPSIPDEGDKEEPKPDEDENVTGTLAFEDIWPSGGDYDMNDVIVEYERKSLFRQKEYSNEDR